MDLTHNAKPTAKGQSRFTGEEWAEGSNYINDDNGLGERVHFLMGGGRQAEELLNMLDCQRCI